jgi:hypothetical protein
MVIFENSQSVFEHPQHFLVFEGLMSSNLQLGNPFPLPVNNSAAFGYVPSGHCRVGFPFIWHPQTIADRDDEVREHDECEA